MKDIRRLDPDRQIGVETLAPSLTRQLDPTTTEVTTVPSTRMLGASQTVCLARRDWSNVRLREKLP